jgi:hypothetical protein
VVRVSAFWVILVVWQGKAAVDRQSLIFEFQLPNSIPIIRCFKTNRKIPLLKAVILSLIFKNQKDLADLLFNFEWGN